MSGVQRTTNGSWRLLAVVGMTSLVAVSAVQAMPKAICVPWVPALQNTPNEHHDIHEIYNGASTHLKGIARGDAVEFYWEFGDGTATAWTSIADPYVLEATHSYFGFVGELFLATLHVRDANGNEDTDVYRIRIAESSDPAVPAHLDVRIAMAVDEGLWWLHKTMIRAQYPDGEPGYGQDYGYWSDPYILPATGVALDAFQLHGSRVNHTGDEDPYVETVQRAMNYLLANVHAFDIGPQPAGNPDFTTNGVGNGIGLVANWNGALTDHRQTYIGGICMLALATSGAPNRVAAVGSEHVYQRTYQQIVQDMVDFFAWGQVESIPYQGGWRYHANYNSSDMSTTQWPPLAMIAARDEMKCVVPEFVGAELVHFLDYTQHQDCDIYHGGFGYSDDDTYMNCTKAAAGIICHHFLGTPLDDPRMQAAYGYLYRHWNDGGTNWDNTRIHGNSYGMYGVMKAMRLSVDPALIREYDCGSGALTGNAFNWYYTPASQAQLGLATHIVQTQHGDGSWDDSVGPNAQYNAFSTGWHLLTLLEGVVNLKPVAVIRDCGSLEFNLNQNIVLDGTRSYHLDSNRRIVHYEWDFDYDGMHFVADATNSTATIVGGYPTTGIRKVALRVLDDDPIAPQDDMQVCEMNVHEPPHCPNPEIGGPYSGGIRQWVRFDASASWDPDNEIEKYNWDLDNDGLYGAEDDDCFGEPSDGVGMIVNWSWTAPFDGVIGLRVTDYAGEFPACDAFEWSFVHIGNRPPVCDAGGPYVVGVDTVLTLDGSGSSDPDLGDSITFHWDLNNDGDYNDSNLMNPPLPAGNAVGVLHDLCLRVEDSFGAASECCTTVLVLPYERPHPGWNWADVGIDLTGHQPTYWSAATGQPADGGLPPLTVLDPGTPPGRPDPAVPGERMLRGFIVAWAVDGSGNEIRWNHLKGDGTVVHYGQGAAKEYNAYAFRAVDAAIPNGAATGTPGVLNLDGAEFAAGYDLLLLDFYAVSANARTFEPFGPAPATNLTLLPLALDLRQETGGPVTTKASFTVWNMNEVKFTGMDRCVTCWDHAWLADYASPNHFLRQNMHTDKGKARIDALASQRCDVDFDLGDGLALGADPRDIVSTPAALLGITGKYIAFPNSGQADQTAANLVGMGTQAGRIQADVRGPTPEKPQVTRRFPTPTDLEGAAAGDAKDTRVMDDRVSGSEKGSVLVFPYVEVRWNAAGEVIQDTFIDLANDYPADVRVQMYWINADAPIEAALGGN